MPASPSCTSEGLGRTAGQGEFRQGHRRPRDRRAVAISRRADHLLHPAGRARARQCDRLRPPAGRHRQHRPRQAHRRRATCCSAWRCRTSASSASVPSASRTRRSSTSTSTRTRRARSGSTSARSTRRSRRAWGGSYINDFIDRGRVKRVYVQADEPYRQSPEDVSGPLRPRRRRQEHGAVHGFLDAQMGQRAGAAVALQRPALARAAGLARARKSAPARR